MQACDSACPFQRRARCACAMRARAVCVCHAYVMHMSMPCSHACNYLHYITPSCHDVPLGHAHRYLGIFSVPWHASNGVLQAPVDAPYVGMVIIPPHGSSYVTFITQGRMELSLMGRGIVMRATIMQ